MMEICVILHEIYPHDLEIWKTVLMLKKGEKVRSFIIIRKNYSVNLYVYVKIVIGEKFGQNNGRSLFLSHFISNGKISPRNKLEFLMTFLKNLMKSDEENHLSMDIIWDFRQSCRANFAILSSQNFVGVSALSM